MPAPSRLGRDDYLAVILAVVFLALGVWRLVTDSALISRSNAGSRRLVAFAALRPALFPSAARSLRGGFSTPTGPADHLHLSTPTPPDRARRRPRTPGTAGTTAAV